jgi:hypothetical protein
MNEPETKTWRKWFTISVTNFLVAGYFLMAYGIGRIVRATTILDATVKQLTANADTAAQRLEGQTQRLVKWTQLLVAVTVLLFVATLVTLATTIWPLVSTPAAAMLSNVASSTRLSVGDEAWTWAGRLSSIITIIGLVVVYLQLRQLIRRPKISVGFHQDPGGPGERLFQVVNSIEMPIHWNPGDVLSQPIRLAVIVMNDASASATAHDVNFEVRYPKWLVPEGIGDLKEPPGMNLWALSKDGLVLNPGLTAWLRGWFRVPRGHDQIRLFVIASMRDGKMIDARLTVSLRES